MDGVRRWRCRTRTLSSQVELSDFTSSVISCEGKEGMIPAASVQRLKCCSFAKLHRAAITDTSRFVVSD